MTWLLGVLAVLAAGLFWQSAGSNQRRAMQRLGYLDAILPLFSAPLKGVAETGFARVSGPYRGQMFDIQVVPDSLSIRKLPCLWLLVTLPAALPVAGTYDVMLRASGHETFSLFSTLQHHLTTPATFPQNCTVRTDTPDAAPDADILAEFLAVLDATRLKELIVAPTGLRVVWLVEEADRGKYLLFRDAEMGTKALNPATLQPLMDALQDLWAQLQHPAAARWVAE